MPNALNLFIFALWQIGGLMLKKIIFYLAFFILTVNDSNAQTSRNCGNGFVIESKQIVYKKWAIRGSFSDYYCYNSYVNSKSGISYIYNQQGNADEPVEYYYFDDKWGLIFRGELILLKSASNWHVLSVPFKREEMDQIRLYVFDRKAGKKSFVKFYIEPRSGCGEIELLGSQQTAITADSVITSRIDGCGQFTIKKKLTYYLK